ncbi:MAG: HlyD family efflux transporter periplasmic adaptor subunit [Anaerolineaceae bacterium]|nr:HlyD family efflux transporter periplasmic adaptor subunit [Anaerolineaceae bacterium]
MKNKLSLITLMIAVIFIISACSPKSTQVAPPVESNTPNTLIAEGKLLPVNTLDQSFTISGTISDVLVSDGASIEMGQVLARIPVSPEAKTALARAQQEVLAAEQALDSLNSNAKKELLLAETAVFEWQEKVDDTQTAYDQDETDQNKVLLNLALENLKLAEDKFERLNAENGLDPDQISLAEARLETANAALISAQIQMDAFELKATMAGTIVDLSLQPGQKVVPGSIVITIADFSGMVIKTDNLSELDIPTVKSGQKTEIIFDALPGITFSGEVMDINVRFEEKRGDVTYTVTVLLDQLQPELRWGMTAAVYFLP